MASSAEHRRARRERIDALKLEAGCADCGYREHPAALTFDHLDGGESKHPSTRGRAYCLEWSWERIAAALAVCEVVCANCHAIRTATRGYTGGKPMHRT